MPNHLRAVGILMCCALLFVAGLLVCTGCGGGGSSATQPPTPPAVPDFVLAVTPSSLSLIPGSSTEVKVSLTPQNGFSGPVSLTSGMLPAGVSISPTLPQNVDFSGLTLTISAAAGTALNTYPLQLTATSGSLQHSATGTLKVENRADVSLGVPSSTLHVPISSPVQLNINVIPGLGRVDYTVALEASAPAGVTASFSPASVTPPARSTLTLSAGATAATGSGEVTIVATRSIDNRTVTSSFPVQIDPKPGTIPGNRTNWVRLGSNPVAIHYDAPRKHVLASLPAVNRVEVIDPATGELISSIPVSVANDEPNGVWLASSSNLSGSLDGKSLYVLGAGHIATIDLASGQVVRQQPTPLQIPLGWTSPTSISPEFLVTAKNGHMVFGSWGGADFYHWDGVSALASRHSISDLYSFDRNFDGSKVMAISGDTGAGYQLLDLASDSITKQGNYTNAVLINVRGNPVREEWALANSNGIDFLDGNLNLVARVQAGLGGSSNYWGMTYSSDGRYLYFVYSPTGLPFLVTVDTATYKVVNIAPATGTDLAYAQREPPEWKPQPFAADSTGMVFGLGEKGLVIDDATYTVDPAKATPQQYAILVTPDNGPVNASTPVEIKTQSYVAQPDVWFGGQRASSESLNSSGQVTATAPPAQTAGPVNIKLFPPDGYVHVIPQAFTYGTVITYIRNSICPASGGCSADIFGFGLFGADISKTTVTIGGNPATVKSNSYFSTGSGYPYPLQILSVTVPPGTPGKADVVVRTASGQATLRNGLRYAVSLQSYASTSAYNALLFDEKRQILYAASDSQIARFSLGSSSFLSPITPPSLTGQTTLKSLALTPDGSRLIVTNGTDSSVALIDPDNPTNAQAVPVPTDTLSGGPVFVAATSTGKALISMSGFPASLRRLDLGTKQWSVLKIDGLFTSEGARLSATSDGSTVLVRAYGRDSGLWNDAKQQLTPVYQNHAGSGVGSAAGDGNVFAVGAGFIAPDGSSTTAATIPDELGGYQSWRPNDSALNDSGSLEFAPGRTSIVAPPSLFILDTHHGDVLGSIILANEVNIWTKTIAVDSSARHVFMADSKGLTVLTLNAAPLAIGWLNPSVASPNGSTSITVRGSGFQTGTTITIGGKTATAVFVDANTLQVTAPANPAGAAKIVVKNPDGETYSLDAGVVYE